MSESFRKLALRGGGRLKTENLLPKNRSTGASAAIAQAEALIDGGTPHGVLASLAEAKANLFPALRTFGYDPHFANVALLVSCDGNLNGTVFTDISPQELTLVSAGTVPHKTTNVVASPVSSSVLVSTDSLGWVRSTNSPGLSLGSDPFTIEAWFCPRTQTSDKPILEAYNGPPEEGGCSFKLWATWDGYVCCQIKTVNTWFITLGAGNPCVVDTWYHVCMQRTAAGTLELYVDGVLESTEFLGTEPIEDTDAQYLIGAGILGATSSSGLTPDDVGSQYIDDVRVTVGVARYTDPFDRPVAAFSAFTPAGGAYQLLRTTLQSISTASADPSAWYHMPMAITLASAAVAKTTFTELRFDLDTHEHLSVIYQFRLDGVGSPTSFTNQAASPPRVNNFIAPMPTGITGVNIVPSVGVFGGGAALFSPAITNTKFTWKVVDSSIYGPLDNAMTFEAWVNLREGADSVNNKTIIAIEQNTYFWLRINPDDTVAAESSAGSYSGNRVFSLTGPTISRGSWHHVACVVTHGTVKLYVDGVMSATVDTPMDGGYVRVGRYTVGHSIPSPAPSVVPNSIFDGYIDSVRVSAYARYTDTFSVPTVPFTVGIIPKAIAVSDPWIANVVAMMHHRLGYAYVIPSDVGSFTGGATYADYRIVDGDSADFSLYLPPYRSTETGWWLNSLAERRVTGVQFATIEVSVRPEAYPVETTGLVVAEAGWTGTAFRLTSGIRLLDTGHIAYCYLVGSGETEFRLLSTAVIPLGEWTQVAVVVENYTTYSLYINGVKDATIVETVPPVPFNGTYVRVGIIPEGYSVFTNRYEGHIGKLRLTQVARYTGPTYDLPTTGFGYRLLEGSLELTASTATAAANLFATLVVTPAIDVDFNSVYLMVSGEVVGQNSQLDDIGYYRRPYTKAGNPSPRSVESIPTIHGYHPVMLDGGQSALRFSPRGSVNLSSYSDWTVEAWVYVVSQVGLDTIILTNRFGGEPFYAPWALLISAAGYLKGVTGSNVDPVAYVGATVVTTGVWHHVAMSCILDEVTLYLDGVVQAVDYYGASTGAEYVYFGYESGLSYTPFTIDGFVAGVRVTRGVGRYTAAFTPPTEAYPLLPDTQTDPYAKSVLFIFRGDGSFESPCGLPAPVFGANTSVSAAQSVYGGSSIRIAGGTTGTVTFPMLNRMLDTLDLYTIEFWIRFDPGADMYILSGGSSVGVWAYFAQYGYLSLFDSGSSSDLGTIGDVAPNTWTHIVMCSNGTRKTAYLNGVKGLDTTRDYAAVQQLTPMIIGYSASVGGTFTGYIQDLRVTNADRYNGAATIPVPTSTYPSISTSTDPHYAKSTIFSGAGAAAPSNRALLELTSTVEYPYAYYVTTNNGTSGTYGYGSATLGTRRSGVGTAAIYFNGRTDSVSYPRLISPVGTRDFTFEAWILPLNNTDREMVALGGTGNYLIQFSIGVDSRGSLFGYAGFGAGSTLTGYTTEDVDYRGSWCHVALCRSGSNLFFFVNGVSVPLPDGETPFDLSGLELRDVNLPVVVGAAVKYNNINLREQFFHGYIDVVRFSVGVSRYIGNFVPPQHRLPYIDGSGTQADTPLAMEAAALTTFLPDFPEPVGVKSLSSVAVAEATATYGYGST